MRMEKSVATAAVFLLLLFAAFSDDSNSTPQDSNGTFPPTDFYSTDFNLTNPDGNSNDSNSDDFEIDVGTIIWENGTGRPADENTGQEEVVAGEEITEDET